MSLGESDGYSTADDDNDGHDSWVDYQNEVAIVKVKDSAQSEMLTSL